jgi:hypothetical protein
MYGVTIDGFWIDDWTYWTHTHARTRVRESTVMSHCCCLVAAFSGGRYPSSGFPNCSLASATAHND